MSTLHFQKHVRAAVDALEPIQLVAWIHGSIELPILIESSEHWTRDNTQDRSFYARMYETLLSEELTMALPERDAEKAERLYFELLRYDISPLRELAIAMKANLPDAT